MTHVKLNHSRYIGQSAALRFVPPDDQRRLSKSIPLLLVLGKFPVPGRPTIWITVGQWPTALREFFVVPAFRLIYKLFVLNFSDRL